MSGYTVTITPSGGHPGARTTITVDTANGAPQVSELTVQADGYGLNAEELPAIDLAGLVAALTPTAIGVPATATAATASAETATKKSSKPASGTRRTAQAARKSQAPKAATRRRGAVARQASAATMATTKREYRRMPPEAEVVAAWEDTQSATKLANHFDVPRHTATGWLRRLRQTGVIA